MTKDDGSSIDHGHNNGGKDSSSISSAMEHGRISGSKNDNSSCNGNSTKRTNPTTVPSSSTTTVLAMEGDGNYEQQSSSPFNSATTTTSATSLSTPLFSSTTSTTTAQHNLSSDVPPSSIAQQQQQHPPTIVNGRNSNISNGSRSSTTSDAISETGIIMRAISDYYDTQQNGNNKRIEEESPKQRHNHQQQVAEEEKREESCTLPIHSKNRAASNEKHHVSQQQSPLNSAISDESDTTVKVSDGTTQQQHRAGSVASDPLPQGSDLPLSSPSQSGSGDGTTTIYRQRSSPVRLMEQKTRDRDSGRNQSSSTATVIPRPPITTSDFAQLSKPSNHNHEDKEEDSDHHRKRDSHVTIDSFQHVPPPPLRQTTRRRDGTTSGGNNEVDDDNNYEIPPGATAVYPNDPLRNAGFILPTTTTTGGAVQTEQQRQQQNDHQEHSSLTLVRGESSSLDHHGAADNTTNDATAEPVIMARLVRDSEVLHDLELRRGASSGPPPSYITEAVEVKEDEVPKRTLVSLMKDWRVIAVVLILLAVIIGLTVGLRQLAKREDTIDDVPVDNIDNETIFLEPDDIANNEMIVEDMLFPLLPSTSLDEIASSGSSHRSAVNWLVENNLLKDLPPYRIVQRYVLAVLYYSTGGTNTWKESKNWLSSKTECDWYQSSSIATFNGMEDVTPCPNDNSTLEMLVLDDNRLFGSIPIDVGLLSNLAVLALPENLLEGALVGLPGRMLNLQRLDLRSNNIEGTLPTYMNQSGLVMMDLSDNSFAGTIPESYGNLKNIEILSLSHNIGINGILPTSLVELPTLQQLNVAGTSVTGSIPGSICLDHDRSVNITVNCSQLKCDCCTC